MAFVIVALATTSFLMSYFAKPRAVPIEIVSPTQELPASLATYKVDQTLADRVVQSYQLALILVESQYSRKNATALDALRTWARNNFQRDLYFLHPLTFDVPESHPSIVECAFHNLFAAPWFFLEEQATRFIAHRIAEFHLTNAYLTFRSDYFDMYGMDIEAATLLARYQADKAKLAVDVLLSSLLWLITIVVGVYALLIAKPGQRFPRSQIVLAYGWMLLALFYLAVGWLHNQVGMIVSAFVCGAIGLYLRAPVVVSLGTNRELVLSARSLSPRIIALCVWGTFTLVGIQILTWIRTGSLNGPDPITLLISSLSGNFLHDPATTKKNITRIIGLLWLAMGLWTAYYVKTDISSAQEIEEKLASLNRPFD